MVAIAAKSQYLVTINKSVAHVCGSVVGCPEILPRLTNQRSNGDHKQVVVVASRPSFVTARSLWIKTLQRTAGRPSPDSHCN